MTFYRSPKRMERALLPLDSLILWWNRHPTIIFSFPKPMDKQLLHSDRPTLWSDNRPKPVYRFPKALDRRNSLPDRSPKTIFSFPKGLDSLALRSDRFPKIIYRFPMTLDITFTAFNRPSLWKVEASQYSSGHPKALDKQKTEFKEPPSFLFAATFSVVLHR